MASHLALEVRVMVIVALEVRLSKNTAKTRVTVRRWESLEDGAALIHILVKDMTNEKEASKPSVKKMEKDLESLYRLMVGRVYQALLCGNLSHGALQSSQRKNPLSPKMVGMTKIHVERQNPPRLKAMASMNLSTRLSRASKNVQMRLWFQNHLHLRYDCPF